MPFLTDIVLRSSGDKHILIDKDSNIVYEDDDIRQKFYPGQGEGSFFAGSGLILNNKMFSIDYNATNQPNLLVKLNADCKIPSSLYDAGVYQAGYGIQITVDNKIKVDTNEIARVVDIPSAVSQLVNDVPYLSTFIQQDPVYIADKPLIAFKTDIPSAVSQLKNDVPYLSSFTEVDPVFTSVSGTLALKTEIPSALSQLINDEGYIKSYTEIDPIYIADKPNIVFKNELSSSLSTAISGHNESLSAHQDIREILSGKSSVSGSLSGTSENIIKYLTINNSEFKLAGQEGTFVPAYTTLPSSDLSSTILYDGITSGNYTKGHLYKKEISIWTIETSIAGINIYYCNKDPKTASRDNLIRLYTNSTCTFPSQYAIAGEEGSEIFFWEQGSEPVITTETVQSITAGSKQWKEVYEIQQPTLSGDYVPALSTLPSSSYNKVFLYSGTTSGNIINGHLYRKNDLRWKITAENLFGETVDYYSKEDPTPGTRVDLYSDQSCQTQTTMFLQGGIIYDESFGPDPIPTMLSIVSITQIGQAFEETYDLTPSANYVHLIDSFPSGDTNDSFLLNTQISGYQKGHIYQKELSFNWWEIYSELDSTFPQAPIGPFYAFCKQNPSGASTENLITLYSDRNCTIANGFYVAGGVGTLEMKNSVQSSRNKITKIIFHNDSGNWADAYRETNKIFYSTNGSSIPIGMQENDLLIVSGSVENAYSKSESDNRYIQKGLPDVPWTNLTLSYATAGSVQFCCKNNIVFIQGAGLNWPSAGTSWQIKSMATGIPIAYKPAQEVKGSVFTEYGQNPYSMSWAHSGSQDLVFWCKDGVSNTGGRVYLSYPVFS